MAGRKVEPRGPMQVSANTKARQEKFIKGFAVNLGHIGKACEAADINRATYYDWQNRDPKFVERLHEKIENINDNLEQIIVAKAHKGDNDLLKFWAKTKMRHRGFVESQEQTTNITAINITFEKATDDPTLIIDQE